jgi:hypothetical protein
MRPSETKQSGLSRSANWCEITSPKSDRSNAPVLQISFAYRFTTLCFRSCTQHVGKHMNCE